MTGKRKHKIRVSDHAVLRYIQRVHGVDVESIREQMIPERVLDAIQAVGGVGKFPTGGCHAVAKDGVVVTVTEYDS